MPPIVKLKKNRVMLWNNLNNIFRHFLWIEFYLKYLFDVVSQRCKTYIFFKFKHIFFTKKGGNPKIWKLFQQNYNSSGIHLRMFSNQKHVLWVLYGHSKSDTLSFIYTFETRFETKSCVVARHRAINKNSLIKGRLTNIEHCTYTKKSCWEMIFTSFGITSFFII